MNNKKLLFFIEEEQNNIIHLIRAMSELNPYFPIEEIFFKNINNQEIDILDRFIFRFTKTVDTMGKRLFPAVLAAMGELEDDMFFRDKLNRLEKMAILNHAEDWNIYRAIRNSLTHEYPETHSNKAAILINAYEKSFALIQIFERIKTLLAQRANISMKPYPTPNTSQLKQLK